MRWPNKSDKTIFLDDKKVRCYAWISTNSVKIETVSNSNRIKNWNRNRRSWNKRYISASSRECIKN